MPGFPTYDSVINALTVNAKGQRPFCIKQSVATVATGKYSLWNVAGMPAAGTFGTALTARVINNASLGAIPFNNATSPATMHLLQAGIGSTVAAGVFVLVDRLLEAPFNGTVTSGTFNGGTPLAIPARDNNGVALGAGCMMFVENVNATATAAVNLTVTYTDQSGNTGHTTGAQAMIVSAQHRIVHDTQGLFMPLAAGDTGVRAIATYTLSASALSTQMNIVVCRPLAMIPMLLQNAYTERDMVLQIPNLPRLYDGTALQWLLIANTTSLGNVHSMTTFAEN